METRKNDQKPCYNQNIHPHTFSLFGSASTAISNDGARMNQLNEADKDKDSPDVGTFARSIFSIVKGIFL